MFDFEKVLKIKIKIISTSKDYYAFRLTNIINDEILFYIEIYDFVPVTLLLKNNIKKKIQNFNKTSKYLLKYKYLLHTYEIKCISIPITINYYNEDLIYYVENAIKNNLIIYNENNICNHTDFILSIFFQKEYVKNKLLDKQILLVNGYFLLNKIIHSYNNPNRLLCQLRFEKNFNLFYNKNNFI
jgi:hypothetical protein